MATAAKRPRTPARRRSAKPSTTAAQSNAVEAAASTDAAAGRTDHGTGAVGGLALALVLGALGFVASIFWVGAMIIMALLLGVLVTERRSATRARRGGVVAEVVAAVVDEVHEITDSTSRSEAR
jgi:predicted lipid-binding transport protein (Tim44 family)